MYNGTHWEHEPSAVIQCVISTLRHRRIAAVNAGDKEKIVNAKEGDTMGTWLVDLLASYCAATIDEFDSDLTAQRGKWYN